MLDIKEIERRLGNGGDVELECIDRDGLLKDSCFENTEILRRDIIVESVCHNSIDIVGSDYPIVESEYKYFKIKGKSYTEKLLDRDSKFTELLSVATKSVNNGDLSSFVVNVADSSDKIGECLYIGANMTYHAIENEIKDLEMKEELEVKEEVDTSDFDEVVNSAFKALKDGVVMEIGLNDGILMIQNGQASVRKCISKSDVAQNGACKYLEYIDSLYTETFVIESEEDEMKIRQPVKSIILANGEEIINEDRLSLLQDGLCLKAGAAGNIKIPFTLLKGATVTQQKGNK